MNIPGWICHYNCKFTKYIEIQIPYITLNPLVKQERKSDKMRKTNYEINNSTQAAHDIIGFITLLTSWISTFFYSQK